MEKRDTYLDEDDPRSDFRILAYIPVTPPEKSHLIKRVRYTTVTLLVIAAAVAVLFFTCELCG